MFLSLIYFRVRVIVCILQLGFNNNDRVRVIVCFLLLHFMVKVRVSVYPNREDNLDGHWLTILKENNNDDLSPPTTLDQQC